MRLRSLLAAIVISVLMPFSAESENSSWYGDVENNNQYHDAIFYLTARAYASGYGDGSFRPENPVTRAEALKLILNSGGIGIPATGTGLMFSDVPEDAWYLPYLQTGLDLGIISGYPDGTFRGENTVNRAEAMKMLLNARGVDVEAALSYADSETPTSAGSALWFQKYMNYAAEKVLLIPDPSGDYLASKELTRGELCEIIYRLYKGNYTGYIEYGGATWYGGRFEGQGTASGDTYDSGKLTAAHKTLPFGTILKVTNLANNLYVTVTINDRGPYRDGYIIDLSSAAFEKIASLSTGLINVRIEEMK